MSDGGTKRGRVKLLKREKSKINRTIHQNWNLIILLAHQIIVKFSVDWCTMKKKHLRAVKFGYGQNEFQMCAIDITYALLIWYVRLCLLVCCV